MNFAEQLSYKTYSGDCFCIILLRTHEPNLLRMTEGCLILGEKDVATIDIDEYTFFMTNAFFRLSLNVA